MIVVIVPVLKSYKMISYAYMDISHHIPPPKKAGLELSRKIIKDLSSNSGSFQEGTRPGKHTKNYGNSPFLMGKSTNYKSPFSRAMLNYQRVVPANMNQRLGHLEVLEWLNGCNSKRGRRFYQRCNLGFTRNFPYLLIKHGWNSTHGFRYFFKKKTQSIEDSPSPCLPSGELTFCHGKSPFLMGKSTISMAIFNCYVNHNQMVSLGPFQWSMARKVPLDTAIMATQIFNGKIHYF